MTHKDWCSDCGCSRQVCLCEPPEIVALRDELRTARAEVDRLRPIVKALPLNGDDDPIVIGHRHWVTHNGKVVPVIIEALHYEGAVLVADTPDDGNEYWDVDPGVLFSTCEAAEAAKEGDTPPPATDSSGSR